MNYTFLGKKSNQSRSEAKGPISRIPNFQHKNGLLKPKIEAKSLPGQTFSHENSSMRRRLEPYRKKKYGKGKESLRFAP